MLPSPSLPPIFVDQLNKFPMEDEEINTKENQSTILVKTVGTEYIIGISDDLTTTINVEEKLPKQTSSQKQL